MNIVSLTNVEFSVGSGPLLEDVTLGIEAGEKIGLVGRNGSGKSSLLRLLAGTLEPDDGTIARSRDLHMATLDQRPPDLPDLTVDEYLAAAGHHRAETVQRYRSLCTQLGMSDPESRLGTLSGGMLRKIALARALAVDADLLMLDEPTNHLDLDSVLWLEQHLASRTGGFIMVTHDRAMLDSVCTSILEIAERRVYRHPGNYSEFLRRRAERAASEDAAEQRRTTILRRELEWLQRGPKARTGKDKGRKDRIDAMLGDEREAELEMHALPAAQRRLGRKVLLLHDVAKRYGETEVISGFSYEFSRGQRVGVIGPNGSGKTTLLDIVAGRVAADRGVVEKGETTVFAYFDQTGSRIDGSLTVIEYLKQVAERIRIGPESSVSAEHFLERFLFPRSMFDQPLDRLSGGEFRRLYLVRVLATSPNVLLFDEPTNDLDIETIRVLEHYLEEFTGCVLLVSHDRALLNRLTDSLLVFDGDGNVESFVGNYDDFRDARRLEREANARGAGAPGKPPTDAVPAGTRRKPVEREEKRGLSFREQQEFDRLPDEIEAAESEMRLLEVEFQKESHDPLVLESTTKRYHALHEEVERKMARWEELGERA